MILFFISLLSSLARFIIILFPADRFFNTHTSARFHPECDSSLLALSSHCVPPLSAETINAPIQCRDGFGERAMRENYIVCAGQQRERLNWVRAEISRISIE
jgi:hypothetical protein